MSDQPAVQALAPQCDRPVHRDGDDGRGQRPRGDGAARCCISRSASPAAALRPRRSRRPRRRWRDGGCGYTEAFGLPALRQRDRQHYAVDHGVSVVDPARIAMTVGASGAFILAFLAAFDAGDRVIVTEPGYPAYRNILQALGIEVVAVPTDLVDPVPADAGAARPGAGADPRPDPGQPVQPDRHHAAARRARAGSPPTARERGIRIVSDEIYHGITYDEPAETMLAFAPEAIVVNSFSKYLRHDRLAARLAGAAAGAGRSR